MKKIYKLGAGTRRVSRTKKSLLLLTAIFGVAITAASFNFADNSARAATIGTYTLASINNTGNGQGGDGVSNEAIMSADGRYVAFKSAATNLVSGDTNSLKDIFVRDLKTGVTTRASVSGTGAQINTSTLWLNAISKNGRYVAYSSNANTLEGGTGVVYANSYLHDMKTGANTWIDNYQYLSISSISNDGRLIFGDYNGAYNVVFDLSVGAGTWTKLAPPLNGVQQSGQSKAEASCDGAFAVFSSGATNLTPSDTNAHADVFLVDLRTGGKVANITGTLNQNSYTPRISCNGDYVTFLTDATNVVTSPTVDGRQHIYRYDVNNGMYDLVDLDSSGSLPDYYGTKNVLGVSDNGRVVFAAEFDSDPFSPITRAIRHVDDQTTENITGLNNAPPADMDKDTKKFIVNSDRTDLIGSDTNGYTDVFTSQIN